LSSLLDLKTVTISVPLLVLFTTNPEQQTKSLNSPKHKKIMVEIDANKNVLYKPLGEESFDKGEFVDGNKRLQTLEEIAHTLSKGVSFLQN
jgi:hypothetical protein